MFEFFSAFFPILSLKPLTRNQSYIMVYNDFVNRSMTTTVPLGTFIRDKHYPNRSVCDALRNCYFDITIF